MRKNEGNIIQIGFYSDVEGFIKEIRQKLSYVKDWGLKDSFKEEVDDLEKMLSNLSKSFSDGMSAKLDTKTFATFKKEMANEINEVVKRIETLEDTVQGLVLTFDSADGGKFKTYISSVSSDVNNLKTTIEYTVKAIEELKSVISRSDGKIQFADDRTTVLLNKELSELQEIKSLREQIASIIDDNKSGSTEISPNMKEAKEQVEDYGKKLEEAQKKLSKGLAGSVGGRKLTTLQYELAVVTEQIASLFQDAGGKYGDKVKDVFSSKIREMMYNAEGEVLTFEERTQKRIEKVREGLNQLGNPSALSMDKARTTLFAPLDISTSSKDIIDKAIKIINKAQKEIDNNPLKIEFVLSSKYSSRKTNSLLSEWQKQIDNIEDDELREKFKGLYETIAKDFKKEIKFTVTPDINNAEAKVNKLIADIKKKVESKIHLQFEIKEADLRKIQGNLDKLTSNLKVNLSDLNIVEVTDSIKEATESLQKMLGVFSKEDLDSIFERMRTSIEGINGSLRGGDKNELVSQLKEILVLYKQYKDMGGTNTLTDLGGAKNVQNWLSKHADDEIQTSNSFVSEGKNGIQGYAEGIREGIPEVVKATEELVKAALKTLQKAQESYSLIGKNSIKEYVKEFEKATDELKRVASKLSDDTIKSSSISQQKKKASTQKTKKKADNALVSDSQPLISKNVSKEIEKAATAIEKEGKSASTAKKKKEDFAKANEKVAKASKKTAEETKSATEAIEAEQKKAEKAREAALQYEQRTRRANDQKVGNDREAALQYEQRTRRANTQKEEKEREAALQYEQKVQKAYTQKIDKERESALQYEQRTRMANAQKEETDREAVLQYEQKTRRANAQKEEKEREAALQYEQKTRRANIQQEEKDREAALQYEQKVQRAYAQKLEKEREATLQYEQKTRRANAQKEEKERETILQYEQKVQKAYAQKTEKEREAALQYEQKARMANAQKAEKESEQVLRETQKINRANAAIKTDMLNSILKDLKGSKFNKTFISPFQDQITQLREQVKHLLSLDDVDYDSIKKLQTELERLKDSVSDKDTLRTLTKAETTAVTNLQRKISNFLKQNSAMSQEFKDELIDLLKTLSNAGGITEDTFRKVAERFNLIDSIISAIDKKGLSFGAHFFKMLKSANAQFLATYFSFQDLVRYLREGLQIIVEVDTALTELRKVSDATDKRLSQSFRESAKTAKELGDTISNVIGVTADWARLGYSVDDAEKLAKVTTLFMTVGDNMTSEDSSSYLISTLKGFGKAADEAEDIVDVYNEVANNWAIDTAGIGEALQRSAASFYAANTDLEKAVALITATNTVIQDPSSVGTLWKTLSARIRGAKTELQELDEEEDEFTETTSKLRDLVMGLTGFDILESDLKTYKDIYEIILGIGEKWQDLSDIEQASLAEALAGKRNSNALLAVLNNLDTLQGAYKSALEAEGSARKEQENYARSVQYSIDVLKAASQEFWTTLINSDGAKFIIDFLTKVVEFLTEITRITHGSLALGGGILLVLFGKDPEGFANNFIKLLDSLGKDLKFITLEMDSMGRVTKRTVDTFKALQLSIKAVIAILVIAAAIKAWQHFNVTVEETQTEIDELTQKIKGIKDEISELENIESKTDNQKERLSYLRSELEIKEKLLKIEERRKAAESVTSKNDSWVKKFTDSFDKDNYTTYLENFKEDKRVKANDMNPGDLAQVEETFQPNLDIKADSELYQELTEKVKGYENQLASLTKGSKEYNRVNSDLTKTSAKRDEIESSIINNYEKEYEDYLLLTQKLNEIKEIREGLSKDDPLQGTYIELEKGYEEYIEKERDFLVKVRELLGKDTSDLTIDKRLNEANSKIAKGNKKELAKLEEEVKYFSLEEKEAWIIATEGAKDAAEALKMYEEYLLEVQEAAENGVATKFDQAKFSEQVNKLDALQSAYNTFVENVENGESKINLDISDIDALREDFGSLESFDEFELKVTADTSGVDEIQDAFDTLLTEHVNQKIALKKINDENKDMIRTQIEMEGVTHESAQRFVEYKLEEAKAAEYALEKESEFQAKLQETARIATLSRDQVEKSLKEFEQGGEVNLTLRPKVDTSLLEEAGWTDAGNGIATLFTSTFSNETEDVAINFTPILADENGKLDRILSPEALQKYAEEVIAGVHEDDLHLQIGAKFTGEDAIEQAEQAAQKIHQLQAIYYDQMGDDQFAAFIEEDVYALMDEAEQLGINTTALAAYKAEKFATGEHPISTALDRAELLALVQMLQITEDEMITLRKCIDLLNGGEIMSEERRNTIIHRIQEITAESIQKATNVKVNYDYGKAAKGASKGGKEAGDAYVEAYEKELKKLEDLRDRGLISEKEYLNRLKPLIDKYFKDRAKYAEKYAEELKKYMDQMLSYYNSVISGVTTLLDKRINALQKNKETTIDALNKEKDAAQERYQAEIDGIQDELDALEDRQDALDDQQKALDEQIDALNEQIGGIDKEIDRYHDMIDAINEANDARQREINLQKAQYELERAQNQRTKLVYTGEVGQMRYERDESTVRDTQENVRQAKDQIAIAALEKKIDLLEKEKERIEEEIDVIEKQKDAIDKQKDALNEQSKDLQKQQEEVQKAMESSSKYYEKLIKKQEEFFDAQIAALEKTKTKWEELAEIDEISKAWGLVSDEMTSLGFTVEDVLNDVPGAFDAFKEQYIAVLQEMHKGDQGYLDGLKENASAIPTEYGKVTQSVTEAKGPIDNLSSSVSTASSNVSTLGTSASTASTSVNNLKTASQGIAENFEALNEVSSLENLNDALKLVEESLINIKTLIGGMGDPGTGSIYGAIGALNTLTLDNLKSAFEELAGAVGGVISALTGSIVGSSGGSTTLFKKYTTNTTAASMTGGGLISGIQAVKDKTDDVIGTSAEEDGANAIGSFRELLKAIENVVDQIGVDKEKKGTLLYSIGLISKVTQNEINGSGGAISAFNDLESKIGSVKNAANALLSVLNDISSVELPDPGSHMSSSGNQHGGSSGSWGKSKAQGDPNVKTNGRSLVGELGPEVVVRGDKYKVVGVNGPEFVNLKKGDIVLNSKDTEELFDKKDLHGKAFAEGSKFTPFDLSDSYKGLLDKVKTMDFPTMREIKSSIDNLTRTVQSEIQNVTTTRTKVTQNNTFNISGVTGEEVAEKINNTLVKTFSGMSLNAYQRSMA